MADGTIIAGPLLPTRFNGLIVIGQIWNETLGAERLADKCPGLGDSATNPLQGAIQLTLVTTALTWLHPAKYTPEVGYTLVQAKSDSASEPFRGIRQCQ